MRFTSLDAAQDVAERTLGERLLLFVVLRVDAGGGLPSTMKHGKLGDRVEGLTTGFKTDNGRISE